MSTKQENLFDENGNPFPVKYRPPVKRTSEQHLSMRPALGSHEGSLEEQYMRVAKEGAEGVLQIAVMEAKGLPALDLNGKSDPYFKIKYGPFSFSSTIIEETLGPVWLSETFATFISGKDLVIEFFDKDAMRSEKMGEVVIPEERLHEHSTQAEWFAITDNAKEKESKPRGLVNIRWEFHPLDTSKKPRSLIQFTKTSTLTKIGKSTYSCWVQLLETYFAWGRTASDAIVKEEKHLHAVNLLGSKLTVNQEESSFDITPLSKHGKCIKFYCQNEKEHREWVQALESAITGEDASSWKVDADLMVSVLKVSNVGGYKNPSVVLCVERDSFTTSTVPTIKEGAAYWSNEDAEFSVTSARTSLTVLLFDKDKCLGEASTPLSTLKHKKNDLIIDLEIHEPQKLQLSLSAPNLKKRLEEAKKEEERKEKERKEKLKEEKEKGGEEKKSDLPAVVQLKINYVVNHEYLSTYSGTEVYGIKLEALLKRENSLLPKLVVDCVDVLRKRGMDTEGLFRISGSSVMGRKLRADIDSGKPLVWDELSVHDVGDLLKTYLRQLPEPLLTFALYKDFGAAVESTDKSLVATKLKELVKRLPKASFDLLEFLTRFFVELAEHKTTNKMTLDNIGICINPNLLYPEGYLELLDTDPMAALKIGSELPKVYHAILANNDVIFSA